MRTQVGRLVGNVAHQHVRAFFAEYQVSGQGRERFARTAQGGFDVIAHPRHRLAPVIVGVPVEIVDPCALGVALRVEAEDQRGEYQRVAAAAF